MNGYRAFVQERANAEDGQVVLNRTTEHAAVVLSIVFDKADRLVEIVSGELDDSVWSVEAVILSAIAFLQRDAAASIHVVVEQNLDLVGNGFLSALRDAGFLDRIRLFRAPAELTQQYRYHFIVADGRHYRFQRDRTTFEAMIQFGVEETGSKLRKLFAWLVSESQQIPLG